MKTAFPPAKLPLIAAFSIEVDMHPARDKVPMVFHDLTLERMAGDHRNMRDLSAGQLGKVRIGESTDTVPTLSQLLQLTSGKVGLVLEMKGLVGEDDGFVKAIANCLEGYDGPVALMSFNHWLLEEVRTLAPHLSLGLVAQGDDSQYQSHQQIADRCNVDFVSYDRKDLPCKFASQFRASGKPLICWTVKSRQQQKTALQYSDQITFEGFDPDSV